MTKSIQQVNQELKNLESAVADAAIELEKLHRDYLNLLSQSLKQQLISACYQICTQLYPQSFIDLSLNDKQNLQQNIRQISVELEPNLIEIVEQKELEPEPLNLNLMAELIKNLPKPKKSSEEDSTAEINLELVKAELKNIEFIEINANSAESEEIETALEESLEEVNFENPEHLILWHKQIERKIKKILDSCSRKVNKYLQEARILPDRIPSQVIDLAMQADTAKGMQNQGKQQRIPHVLHLALESEGDKSLETRLEEERPRIELKRKGTRSDTGLPLTSSKLPKDLVQISLLRLRLAELEYHNPLLNAKRGQIRNLMAKVKKLNNRYRDIKQEAVIIEAQAAWRSSWYED